MNDDADADFDILDLIASLPQDPAPGVTVVPARRRRAAQWAGRLLVLRGVGFNTRATSVLELEGELADRRELHRGERPDYNHNACRLRSAAVLALADAGAAWGARRVGAGEEVPSPSLPDWFVHGTWKDAVHAHLRRHVHEHEAVTRELERSDALAGAELLLRVPRSPLLVRALLQDTLAATGASSVRDDARQSYSWYCRVCGDAECRTHCGKSVIGEHRADAAGAGCARCGLTADPGVSTCRWSALEGSPTTWWRPPRPTEEEEAFDRAQLVIFEMMARAGEP